MAPMQRKFKATAGCHTVGTKASLYIPQSSAAPEAWINSAFGPAVSGTPGARFVQSTGHVRLRATGDVPLPGPVYLIFEGGETPPTGLSVALCKEDVHGDGGWRVIPPATMQPKAPCSEAATDPLDGATAGPHQADKKSFIYIEKTNQTVIKMTSFCELVAGVATGNSLMILFGEVLDDSSRALHLVTVLASVERFEAATRHARELGWALLRYETMDVKKNQITVSCGGENKNIPLNYWENYAEFDPVTFNLAAQAEKACVMVSGGQDETRQISWTDIQVTAISMKPMSLNAFCTITALGVTPAAVEWNDKTQDWSGPVEEEKPVSGCCVRIQRQLTPAHYTALRTYADLDNDKDDNFVFAVLVGTILSGDYPDINEFFRLIAPGSQLMEIAND